MRRISPPGRSMLASGALLPNPAELLGDEWMREVLALIGEEFNVVIVDSLPLLSATDAAILGRSSVGELPVVRAGKTEEQRARREGGRV